VRDVRASLLLPLRMTFRPELYGTRVEAQTKDGFWG